MDLFIFLDPIVNVNDKCKEGFMSETRVVDLDFDSNDLVGGWTDPHGCRFTIDEMVWREIGGNLLT